MNDFQPFDISSRFIRNNIYSSLTLSNYIDSTLPAFRIVSSIKKKYNNMKNGWTLEVSRVGRSGLSNVVHRKDEEPRAGRKRGM